jgi:putative ABC transport system permease protein
MWHNYWTVAVRILAKNKTYSVINVAGLAIGVAACLMIFLYIQYERSYDTWLPDVKNTYEVQAWSPHPHSGQPSLSQMTGYPAKNAIAKDFPQVTGASYALDLQPVFVDRGRPYATEGYLFTDSDFLRVVDLPLVAGTSLSTPGLGVITRSEALRRYGTDNVLGKTLTIIVKGETHDYRITGVLKDLPKNSSLQISAILRVDFNSFFGSDSHLLTCWSCRPGWLFLKLRPQTNIGLLEAQMPRWETRNIPNEQVGEIQTNAGDEQDWHFVNLRHVHLGVAQDGAMTPGNDPKSISTLAIIALLIMATAVANFVNLTTARAGQRAREVAIRKVVGATRKQLLVQFLLESVVLTSVATLIAMAVVEISVSSFGAFLGADLSLNYLGAGGALLPIVALTLLVGAAGGLYPAISLSRYKPAAVLKANHSASEAPGSGRVRTTLVVAQFAVSVGLIICPSVIYDQTKFARSADPGFKRDHILQIGNMDRMQLLPRGEELVDQMKRIPGVVSVGRSDIGVATMKHSETSLLAEGTGRPVTISNYNVDEGFLDAVGLKLLAGRWFDANRPADDMTFGFPPDKAKEAALASRGVNVVMNELAIERLGFTSPRDAIGRIVKGSLFGPGVPAATINIIGVVANARFGSIRNPLEPIMLQNATVGQAHMIIRYRGDPATVGAAVERKWKDMINDVPFESKFSEDALRDLYQKEDATARLVGASSILALIIGCLGLFGLAAFTVERRTKEIGIRKVLGARTRNIVQLLVWQLSRPVIMANVIAWPIVWWVMRNWLNKFDQRIELTAMPFVIAGAIVWGLAMATVAGHAIRVAVRSPIEALRYE